MNGKTKIFDVVEAILRRRKETRDNDFLLYQRVMNYNGISVDKSFREVTELMRTGKLPSFASVERARRKVQEIYPELAPSAKAQEAKDFLEEEYRFLHSW